MELKLLRMNLNNGNILKCLNKLISNHAIPLNLKSFILNKKKLNTARG